MIRQAINLAALLFAAIIMSATASAQNRIGTIEGTVRDPNGAVLAGATVTLRQSVTGYEQSAQSNTDGAFRLVNVPFNNYTVRVEAPGFQAVEQAIDLHSNVPYSLDLKLNVGQQAAVVNVTGDS